MGAIQFIETLDRTSLTISDEEFEGNVEAAVSAIAEKHERHEQSRQFHVAEKSSPSRPEVTPRNSMEGEWSSPRRSTSSRDGGVDMSNPMADEQAAVAGLLRSIQRPLSTIGRIFSDESSSSAGAGAPTARHASARDGPPATPQPIDLRRHQQQRSPVRNQRDARRSGDSSGRVTGSEPERVDPDLTNQTDAGDAAAAARQASAETAEAQRIQRLEHSNVVEYVSSCLLIDICSSGC